jgi:triacylglycerol lipase
MKTPIVLHHGLFGRDEYRLGPLRRSYFHRIERAIAQEGHLVIATRVHPTAGVETRARQLKQQILDRLAIAGLTGQRVLLIAHSMGGLDARYMVTHLGMARHVAGVLTVATPHRGSPFADWVQTQLGQRVGLLPMLQKFGLDLGAIIDLTTRACARFNEQVPDHPDVKYASITCGRPLRQMPAFAFASHHVIESAEGENDGLVSRASAAWGDVIADWPVDHWQAINRHFAIRHPADDISPSYLGAIEGWWNEKITNDETRNPNE